MKLTIKPNLTEGDLNAPHYTCYNETMKETLTAVIKHQWVKEHFLIIGEARQHLSVNVTTVAKLPLLEPVEFTWAKKMVVPQNPEEKYEN